MRSNLIIFLFLPFLILSCAENQDSSNEDKVETPSLPAQSRLDATGTSLLMEVVTNYYSLKDAFVASNEAKADEASAKLIASSDSLRNFVAKDSSLGSALNTELDSITLASKAIIDAKDETTEKKRIPFEIVSNNMFQLLKKAELKNAGVYREYCPMAFNDKGAYWLSDDPEIKNPYFGKKMLECGEVTDSLK
jgi:hypothetical protein